jgi:uncharacterized membrane protein YdbT with pleckstrin-like domain
MITLNEKGRLPEMFQWYLLTELSTVAAAILIFCSIMDLSWGIAAFWLYSLFIIIPGLVYLRIYSCYFYFTVSAGNLTITSGIFTKRSKSINFDAVQNVENEQGLIQRAFKLATTSIWTASPQQGPQGRNAPDIQLILNAEDAEWLKNYIRPTA